MNAGHTPSLLLTRTKDMLKMALSAKERKALDKMWKGSNENM